MQKLRVGVMGLGSIFHRVMKGFDRAENCELYAVAARDAERARAEAERYGAKKAFGSYEELAECPDVDLIYIATPHNFHREQTLMCLEKGKHVLCEKAFAMNGTEAREMAAMARDKGLFLMEAMWTRFLPAIKYLKAMHDAGELGQIRHIAADFAYASEYDPESRIYAPGMGGGALMDVGIYPLSICEYILGAHDSMQVNCVKAPSGVDARTVMQLGYADGATAQLMSGIDVNGTSMMTIYADKATVVVPDFWHATKLIVNGNVIEFPAENEGHHYQFDHAAEMIAEGKTESDVMPLDETIRLMDVMTAARHDNGIYYPGE